MTPLSRRANLFRVTCEVCGSDSVIERRFADSRGYGKEYVCTWCMFEVLAIVGKPPRLLPYRPVGERWAAGIRKNRPLSEHAVTNHAVTGKATLCGVEDANIDVYRHTWRPTAPNACHECTEVAYEVDARWPPDRRQHPCEPEAPAGG